MLTAKELRIGNWVHVDCMAFPRSGNFRVSGVHSDDTIFIQDWANPNSNWRLKQDEGTEISPIPLTEEWLLRFGFEEFGFYHAETSYKLGPYFLHGKWFHKLTGNGEANILNDELEYVHQLQNIIFALDGKELEIKSPATI